MGRAGSNVYAGLSVAARTSTNLDWFAYDDTSRVLTTGYWYGGAPGWTRYGADSC